MSNIGTALITGASSGIGAVYADRLAHRGYDLILVARRRLQLEQVSKSIQVATDRRVEIIEADLSAADQLERIEKRLESDGAITMLINNAGIASTAAALEAEVSNMSAMVALNVNATMRLTYAALPGFVKRAHGTIINIGSVAALAPERLNGVYAGTKAFVLAFSQSLRSELAGTGVQVQVVMPGATATDIWQAAGSSRDLVATLPMMPVHELVGAALNGLERSEFATLPSLHDETLWNAFEAARLAMAGQLSASTRAPRYLGG